MKDYLNKDERVSMLFFKKYIDQLEKMTEEWGKNNNLTKDEKKALKTATTWGLKAFNSIVERLSDQTVKTFINSLKQSYIDLRDKFAIESYHKKLSSKLDDAYELNRDYYFLVENIMDRCCKNCTEDHNNCPFAEEFESHCIPEADEMGHKINCRYSYTVDK